MKAYFVLLLLTGIFTTSSAKTVEGTITDSYLCSDGEVHTVKCDFAATALGERRMLRGLFTKTDVFENCELRRDGVTMDDIDVIPQEDCLITAYDDSGVETMIHNYKSKIIAPEDGVSLLINVEIELVEDGNGNKRDLYSDFGVKWNC